jgi:gamma-glutamyltranspeptidase / glutathione hydrolase
MKRIAPLFAALFALFLSSNAGAQRGVVTSADPRATEAGREILREGGSATDAAIATMVALSVVEPQSSGIGGGGFLVNFDAKTGKTGTIDGREKAPASASESLFLGTDGKPMGFREAFVGGKSTGVPGNIALAAQAHKKWGRIKWARLFAPAIKLADEGYVITPRLAEVIAKMSRAWDGMDATKAIYWQDGRPKVAGDRVRNPSKALLLRDIARRGPKAFYTGGNAQAIANAVSTSPKNPAPMTVKDIAAYRAVNRDAVCTTYRVYTLCGMGPPSSGATTVFQILGMVERFDMKALGKDSPVAWHLIAEAMQLAYADRELYLGDADFVAVPVKGLLDKAYIAQRSATISEAASLLKYEAGTPPGAPKRTAAISSEASGTTHFIAVDKFGSVATWTSTVEGPFGSQLVANGVILNNELTDFTFAPMKDGAPVANRVQPGKRPVSSMSPTIVFDASGKPVFTVGAAGGKTIIMQVAKTLIAHLDWGMPSAEALAAPNVYFGGQAVLVEKGSYLEPMLPQIAKLGQTVVASSQLASLKANAAHKTVDGWVGAADPRSDGNALTE